MNIKGAEISGFQANPVSCERDTVAQLQMFGGGWTEQSLDMLEGYLKSWVQVMKNQPFERVYIDALPVPAIAKLQRCRQTTVSSPRNWLTTNPAISGRFGQKGSSYQPGFDRYVFVEKTVKRCKELMRLKEEFPALAERMALQPGWMTAIRRS